MEYISETVSEIEIFSSFMKSVYSINPREIFSVKCSSWKISTYFSTYYKQQEVFQWKPVSN
jgi:hypothetical protein